MDGDSASKTLEALVAQNESTLTELKNKLKQVISVAKDYEENIESSLIVLLRNNDLELLSLAVQAIAELSKCEKKRLQYAQKDIISAIINILKRDYTSDRIELVKHCYRALGNLFCDCDEGRKIVMENDEVNSIIDVVKKSGEYINDPSTDVSLYFCKCMLNFILGGAEMSEKAVSYGLVDYLHKVLKSETEKEDMNDDIVLSALLVLSVINDNTPETQFSDEVNRIVLTVLKEAANIEISEVCLDILHLQAEHDSVKTLLASEGAAQLLCSRLELVRERGGGGVDDADVKALTKQACDLLIIILTGDDAMHMLYNGGVGATYVTMVRWLDAADYDLLATAILAIGNFARSDAYCVQMMQDSIFDKLLYIFEVHNGFSVRMAAEPAAPRPIDEATVNRIQHAVLAALRNLAVPAANKRVAAAGGRAAPLMMRALPKVTDHHVAYKLLAAIRMLVDGQEGVAQQFVRSPETVAAAVRWGRAAEHAGAAGEAPRLLAWSVKHLRSAARLHLLQVDGCVSCLVNMMVASHAVMQNEAILALTLLAMEALKRNGQGSPDGNDAPKEETPEESFTKQLIEAEIGKHVAVLVETNCAKMPVEVAENLLAFLDITAKKPELVADYVTAKVHDSINKLAESRKDFGDDIRRCITGIAALLNGGSD